MEIKGTNSISSRDSFKKEKNSKAREPQIPKGVSQFLIVNKDKGSINYALKNDFMERVKRNKGRGRTPPYCERIHK